MGEIKKQKLEQFLKYSVELYFAGLSAHEAINQAMKVYRGARKIV